MKLSLCFVFSTVGAIFNTRVQGTLIEPMAPRIVKVCIGSHTTINCSFHADAKRLKVHWYLYNTSNFNDSKKIEFNSSTGSSHYNEEKGSSASYLTIRNVTFNDRGGYFCEVTQDIPQLIKERSNVTHLVICKYNSILLLVYVPNTYKYNKNESQYS